jgi:hypothetical protein
MPQMMVKISETANGIADMIGYAQKLSAKKVNFSEIYAKVYGERPEEGRSATNWDNRRADIENIVVKEMATLGQDSTEWFNGLTSAWQMANAVQGYYQNVKGKNKNRTPFAARDWANSRPQVAATWAAVAA